MWAILFRGSFSSFNDVDAAKRNSNFFETDERPMGRASSKLWSWFTLLSFHGCIKSNPKVLFKFFMFFLLLAVYDHLCHLLLVWLVHRLGRASIGSFVSIDMQCFRKSNPSLLKPCLQKKWTCLESFIIKSVSEKVKYLPSATSEKHFSPVAQTGRPATHNFLLVWTHFET